MYTAPVYAPPAAAGGIQLRPGRQDSSMLDGATTEQARFIVLGLVPGSMI